MTGECRLNRMDIKKGRSRRVEEEIKNGKVGGKERGLRTEERR